MHSVSERAMVWVRCSAGGVGGRGRRHWLRRGTGLAPAALEHRGGYVLVAGRAREHRGARTPAVPARDVSGHSPAASMPLTMSILMFCRRCPAPLCILRPSFCLSPGALLSLSRYSSAVYSPALDFSLWPLCSAPTTVRLCVGNRRGAGWPAGGTAWSISPPCKSTRTSTL